MLLQRYEFYKVVIKCFPVFLFSANVFFFYICEELLLKYLFVVSFVKTNLIKLFCR